MVNPILRKVNEQFKKKDKVNKIIDYIKKIEDNYSKIDDESLKEQTNILKKEFKTGRRDISLISRSLCVIKEAIYRIHGKKIYDVQIMGAIALIDGNIAEMKTGEGKTFTSTLAAYYKHLEGKTVHMITSNNYLARRDRELSDRLFQLLGLKTGYIESDQSIIKKRGNYRSDIVYGIASEFAFDYLRDNMVNKKKDKVQEGLQVAIIDEIDLILIDEAKTPLIISNVVNESPDMYQEADNFVRSLKNDDYILDYQNQTIYLTEKGVNKTEEAFLADNLYKEKHMKINYHISKALKAHFLLKKDVDYVVKDGDVLIIDPYTGRYLNGRKYSDGLHLALEAKEKCDVKEGQRTLAKISYQHFFNLYKEKCGMTGTAKRDEEEFMTLYNMKVKEIPTNKVCKRMIHPDVFFKTKKEKYKAIIKKVKEANKKGQPVLIGTVNIKTSEVLSKELKKEGIKHALLNAKQDYQEASIIQKAGESGSVTIATNMAGRGTDIEIDTRARESGGLLVIGTERHESRRIDEQLIGRTGRQGEPGEAVFYLSLEDELIEKSDELIKGEESKLFERIQKINEGFNFDQRTYIYRFDDILDKQRMTIFEQRDQVIEQKSVCDLVENMIVSYCHELLESINENNKTKDEQAIKGIERKLNEELGLSLSLEKREEASIEKIKEELVIGLVHRYREIIGQTAKPTLNKYLKGDLLKIIDSMWVDYLEDLTHLKEGIFLMSYAMKDPFLEYEKISNDLYHSLLKTMRRRFIKDLLNKKTLN